MIPHRLTPTVLTSAACATASARARWLAVSRGARGDSIGRRHPWIIICPTDEDEGVLRRGRLLICDRDRKWSQAVERFLETAGVRLIRTPLRAPNCNAHAERFVRSIKEECLHRVIPFGERHLRRTLTDFVMHYHGERNHQDWTMS
jgi:hypothetical protein